MEASGGLWERVLKDTEGMTQNVGPGSHSIPIGIGFM